MVEFADASLRLMAPGEANDDVYVEWQAEVGFLQQWRPTWPMLVGQVGFFDQFTVTMSRFALQTAVEPAGAFDARYGVQPAPPAPDVRESARGRRR
jgi:hypothetical protein